MYHVQPDPRDSAEYLLIGLNYIIWGYNILKLYQVLV